MYRDDCCIFLPKCMDLIRSITLLHHPNDIKAGAVMSLLGTPARDNRNDIVDTARRNMQPDSSFWHLDCIKSVAAITTIQPSAIVHRTTRAAESDIMLVVQSVSSDPLGFSLRDIHDFKRITRNMAYCHLRCQPDHKCLPLTRCQLCPPDDCGSETIEVIRHHLSFKVRKLKGQMMTQAQLQCAIRNHCSKTSASSQGP
jgi:hypothetical protein